MEKKGVPDIIGSFVQLCGHYFLEVDNAGSINANNKIWEVPAEEFDMVMDTNVKDTANMMHHFLPWLVERKQGIIVTMSSGWGRSGAALVAPYCASKWAIEGLSRSVAKEVPEGMAVVARNPSVIDTDMLASCFGNSASLYQSPDAWSVKAAATILNLTSADNGSSLNSLSHQYPGQIPWCFSDSRRRRFEALPPRLCAQVVRTEIPDPGSKHLSI